VAVLPRHTTWRPTGAAMLAPPPKVLLQTMSPTTTAPESH
jgi:hypothetical protein